MLLQKVSICSLIILAVLIQCGKKEPAQAGDTGSIQQQLQEIMKQPEKTDTVNTSADSAYVKKIGNLDYLDSLIKNTTGKLLVFDLYADWCVPCKMLAPLYDTLAKVHAGDATFYRIDVQKHQDIASAFSVQSIPLVVFIKDKEVIHSITGLNPREQYENVIVNCGSSVPLADCTAKLKKEL